MAFSRSHSSLFFSVLKTCKGTIAAKFMLSSELFKSANESFERGFPEGFTLNNFMTRFVENYFKDSFQEMVSFFAKEQKLSPDDLKEIIDDIEKGEN